MRIYKNQIDSHNRYAKMRIKQQLTVLRPAKIRIDLYLLIRID